MQPQGTREEGAWLSGCASKHRHRDQAAARRHLRRVGSPLLVVYACRFCGGWHLGNRPQGESQHPVWGDKAWQKYRRQAVAHEAPASEECP